jgi:hypothetical protein
MRRYLARLVQAAAQISGPRFRILAAASVIATSSIIGSALAGGGTGLLGELLANARGELPAASAPRASAGKRPSGPEIPPPPPAAASGPSAQAPAPAPAPTPASAPSPAPAPAPEKEPETEPTEPKSPTPGSGPIKHVFVISLASPGYDAAFGTGSQMPYLSGTLRPDGELLSGYSLLTENALPNYVAMVSGQPPNESTRANCPTYDDFPQSSATPDAHGVIAGDGCVYPVLALTLADQLNSGGLTWHAYMEDMADETGPHNCVHPDAGAADPPAQGGYASAHNPFAYFHSLLDLGACATNDVPLDQLSADLRKLDSTANFSFIAPNLCNAGVPDQCPGGDPAAAPPASGVTTTTTPTTTTTTTTPPTTPRAAAAGPVAGPAAADAFLRHWVPAILKSPAYKKDGLLVVTFGEAQPPADAAEPAKVGTLLLSGTTPAGQTVGTPYNPYSLLRSIEDLLVLDHLARADAKGTASFASTVVSSGD